MSIGTSGVGAQVIRILVDGLVAGLPSVELGSILGEIVV